LKNYLILATFLLSQNLFALTKEQVETMAKEAKVVIEKVNLEKKIEIEGNSPTFRGIGDFIDALKKQAKCKNAIYTQPKPQKKKNHFLITCE
jgi:hypothetical protein